MSGFWTARRAAVAAQAQSEEQAALDAAAQAQEVELAARDDDDLLSEFGLPAPEELLNGEQLRAFLKAQLPQRLKSRALRAFWRTNPVLACVDGLNDYDDDYTVAATAGKAVNTLYEVGKGFAAPVSEVLETVTEQDEAPATTVLPDVSVPDVTPPQPTAPSATAVADAGQDFAASDEADLAPASTPRRMRFTFPTDTESVGV